MCVFEAEREKGGKYSSWFLLFLPQTLTMWKSCRAHAGGAYTRNAWIPMGSRPHPSPPVKNSSTLIWALKDLIRAFPLPPTIKTWLNNCFLSLIFSGKYRKVAKSKILMVSDCTFIFRQGLSFPSFQFKIGDKEVHKRKVSPPLFAPTMSRSAGSQPTVLSTASAPLLPCILGHWRCCRELH